MKVEVQFIGGSIDAEVYEGVYVTWTIEDHYVHILSGTKEETFMVASYPESRVVRMRVIEPAS